MSMINAQAIILSSFVICLGMIGLFLLKKGAWRQASCGQLVSAAGIYISIDVPLSDRSEEIIPDLLEVIKNAYFDLK